MLFITKANTALGLNMRFLSKAELGSLDTKHSLLPPSASRIPGEPCEVSMRCCKKNATIQKVLRAEHLKEGYLLQVFCVPAERPLKDPTQFPRGRAYTNRAKLLDGLSQQFFFKHSSFLLSPRGESGKFSQAEDALATEHLSKHIIYKTLGFFLSHFRKFNCSKALFNQLVQSYSWAQALKRLFQPFL